jgi:hypothetical protein
LLRWGALVLLLHLGFLLSLAGTLNWQLGSPQTLRTGPMQTRTISPLPAAQGAIDPVHTQAARTRVALVEKTKVPPQPDATKTAAAPQTTSTDKADPPAAPPEPAKPVSPTAPDPVTAQDHAIHPLKDPSSEKDLATATGPQASDSVVADAPISVVQPATPNHSLLLADNATLPTQAAKDESPTPERIASATMALPDLALASMPPSALLSYRLNGQEKGLSYQASGELRWQRNESAYAMSLTVKAFLLGSRHWRSVGQINATGLAPTRFSDSWRSERAVHFDRPNQRIVFSSNAPTVALQPGAQDQVSLYVQLAAAMAQSGHRMQPGTRLQIQTATVRDALPWLLTMEKLETLQLAGQSVHAVKWVCQPRNRFDAQVEFWVSAAHDWLPARIRITQVSGNFIDLQLTGRQVLDALPTPQ